MIAYELWQILSNYEELQVVRILGNHQHDLKALGNEPFTQGISLTSFMISAILMKREDHEITRI